MAKKLDDVLYIQPGFISAAYNALLIFGILTIITTQAHQNIW